MNMKLVITLIVGVLEGWSTHTECVLHNTVGFQKQNDYGRRNIFSGENLVVHLLFVNESFLASSVTEVS